MTDEPDKGGNDLTPEQKTKASRELKKLLEGVEDDEEIFHYLAPFREETEGDAESSPQPGGDDGEEDKKAE
jgi:hypothetical protein